MNALANRNSASCALGLLLIILLSASGRGQEKIRIERFKSQATPFPRAVRVANARLVHTTQLMPSGALAGDPVSQCQDVLKELDRLLEAYDSKRSDVVKLNVYVKDAAVRESFLKELAKWGQDELPAVAIVATRLPETNAQIGLDGVFVSRRETSASLPTRDGIPKGVNSKAWAKASVLPLGDVVYVSGQAQPGELAEATRKTLEELSQTLKFLELDKRHIVQVKCFVRPMKEISAVNREIEKFFGEEAVPPVSHVEWISPSLPIEIELVASAPPKESAETVTYLTPPFLKSSPVFSRVARIHGNDRIYISGLFSKEQADGETEVRLVFDDLKLILKETGSDLKHLAKATYYVASDKVSQELNRQRPHHFDPKRPPAASKAAVSDVGTVDRKLTLDMIAAPISR